MTRSDPSVRTIACIGDLHGSRRRLEAILRWLGASGRIPPDLVLLTGDFAGTTPSRPAGQRELDRALRQLAPLGAPVVLVPGNHDEPSLNPGAEARARNADRALLEVAGLRIFGLGGAPTTIGLPYEWTDAELGRLEFPECEVLLTHTPPAGTRLDTLPDGTHAGSHVVRRVAEGQPVLLVCGHIHEAAGAQALGGSICYNAGSLGPPYGEAQVGVVRLDLATGGCRIEHRFPGDSRGWTFEGKIEP